MNLVETVTQVQVPIRKLNVSAVVSSVSWETRKNK